MIDACAALRGQTDVVRTRDLAFEDFDAFVRERSRALARADECAHRMAGGSERTSEMLAREARRTGHQHLHGALPSSAATPAGNRKWCMTTANAKPAHASQPTPMP